MTNIITTLVRRQLRFPANIWLVTFLLTIGLTSGWQRTQATTPQQLAQATTPQNAPADLKNLLTQVDAAASQGNVKAVLQFYSPNFTHGDGLNLQTLEKSLISLWQRYPKLQYSTKLLSSKPEGNGIIAETETKITSLPSGKVDNLTLNATIKSRQRIQGGKIVRQDILSERTLLTSGSKPPQIDIKLPEQVQVGQARATHSTR